MKLARCVCVWELVGAATLEKYLYGAFGELGE